MTDQGGPGPVRRDPTPEQVTPGSSSLENDPEAMEDPVHCGDAQQQHGSHRRESAGSD